MILLTSWISPSESLKTSAPRTSDINITFLCKAIIRLLPCSSEFSMMVAAERSKPASPSDFAKNALWASLLCTYWIVSFDHDRMVMGLADLASRLNSCLKIKLGLDTGQNENGDVSVQSHPSQ